MTIQWDPYCVAAIVVTVAGIIWAVYYEHFAK